jgi:hypothetical protein
MKKLLFFLLIIIILSQGCIAKNNSYFVIEVGTKPNQLGYNKGLEFCSGPIAITEFESKIFILDKENYKVNIYSIMGDFLNFIKIPNGFKYRDIVVNPKFKDITLLTDKGIYIIKNDKLKKINELPDIIKNPYYLAIDKHGNIGMTGLDNKGRLKTGIYSLEGFIELNGFGLFFSYSGIQCLQTNHKEVSFIENNSIVKKLFIDIQSDATPIGIDDEMNVYYVEPIKRGLIIYRIDKNGKIVNKKVNYSSRLIEDPVDVIRFVRVTPKGEIIALEVNPTECRVLRINL